MSCTGQSGLYPFSDSFPVLATFPTQQPKHQSRRSLENSHQITDPERNIILEELETKYHTIHIFSKIVKTLS